MWPTEILLLIGATFLLAGFVKGIVGMGLPTVSLAILTTIVGLRDAMALMILPSLATNFYQGLAGPVFGEVMRRFWPMLLATLVGTFVGLNIGMGIATTILASLLGCVLLVYAVSGLRGFNVNVNPAIEWLLTPSMGFLGGAMSGLVGVFIVPAILYLQMLKMPKEVFIQTMGVTLTVATLSLGLALSGFDLYSTGHAMTSAGALVPAFAGLYLGQLIRARLSEGVFRTVIFWALGFFGVYLILGAVL